jgi:subfamily B ATP-binding cassette protein MsbA
MDNGKIIEQGTHEQLLRVKDGLYRNLSELQFAG